MRRNGYDPYHGRSRGRTVLKVLIGVLLVLLVVSIAALFFLEPYIHYSIDGVRLELPFFQGAEEDPDPLTDTVPIQVATPPRLLRLNRRRTIAECCCRFPPSATALPSPRRRRRAPPPFFLK